MKFLKTLFLILFLLTPFGVLAEESGTLANLKVATGTDLASTNCCEISRVVFHTVITGAATVQIGCSIRSDGGDHDQIGSNITASESPDIRETTFPCTNIQSDVTVYSSGTVTVDYKVIH